MTHRLAATILRADEQPRTAWDDALHGSLSWMSLFDRATTPTAGLTAGVAELQPGQGGRTHRHAQPEIYLMLEGSGMLTVSGAERRVATGDAVFIPGNCWHSLRNDGPAPTRLLYVFPADSLDDVVHEYAPETGGYAPHP